KNASLGEMISALAPLGVNIPDGFAVTSNAFYDFLSFNALSPRLQEILNRLNRETLENLSDVGRECRALFKGATFSGELRHAIIDAYEKIPKKEEGGAAVAVRSSATAEDSPTASFAGQHDSFLNVVGAENVVEAVKR